MALVDSGPIVSGKEFLSPVAAPPTGSGSAPGGMTAGGLGDRSISMASFTLDVPDSPAFAALGISPENVVRPSNPQELVTSVLNGVDHDGHFQTGLALDTAPYLLFFGKDVTLERYQHSYITRLLTRTQLSFASSKGTEKEDGATRLALGLHLTLLDRGDPRFDVDLQQTYDSIDAEIRAIRGPIPPGADMQLEADRREAAMRPMFKAAFAEARRRNWNRTNWSLGAAPSWISPQGDGDDFRWNGATVWTSFAYGFEGIPVLEKSSQLILHARYRDHEEVPNPVKEGEFMRQDSLLLGGRLRIGTVDTNASIDAGWIREWGGGRENNVGRIAAGLERRMTKNLWLSLSAGKEFGNEDKDDALTILANFKLGFGDEPAPVTTMVMTPTPVVLRPEADAPPANDEDFAMAPPSGAEDAVPRVPPKAPRPNTPVNAGRAELPSAARAPAKAERPAVSSDMRRAAPPPGTEPQPQTVPEKAQRPKSSGARRADFPSATPIPAAAPPKANRPQSSTAIRRAATPPAMPAKANRPDPRGSGRRAVVPEE